MSNYIRFDWAIKRLLRDKANFGVLEGFLTTLLDEPIHISRLLESEGNQEREDAKTNRVDLLAENDRGELFLIEVQNNNEYAYFQRMLFGTSKLVTEYINRGDNYYHVKKVYAVNIMNFPLGQNNDVMYQGKTDLLGTSTGKILQTTVFQRQKFNAKIDSQLYPYYYILNVNDFNTTAKTPLEEWILYLKTGDIPETATAPGLAQARERLLVDHLSDSEHKAYFRHIDNLVSLRDTIVNSRKESRLEGFAEGKKQGLAEARAKREEQERAREIARQMKADGMPATTIARYTGIPESEVAKL